MQDSPLLSIYQSINQSINQSKLIYTAP